MAIPKNIKARIVRGYQTAASNGDANAANFLSVCYASGFGVEIDKEEMVSWAIKAAELGTLDPVKSIASYYKLKDLRDDGTLLFPWLLKAAESGHNDSIRLVGECYLGTEQNWEKYDEWISKYSDTQREPSKS